jgi:ferredoxin
MTPCPETLTVRLSGAEGGTAVSLPPHSNLSAHLDINNSPILFGCRTGICGTCVCVVQVVGEGCIPPPSDDEREVLELVAPRTANARLACKIDLTADIAIHSIGANE